MDASRKFVSFSAIAFLRFFREYIEEKGIRFEDIKYEDLMGEIEKIGPPPMPSEGGILAESFMRQIKRGKGYDI